VCRQLDLATSHPQEPVHGTSHDIRIIEVGAAPSDRMTEAHTPVTRMPAAETDGVWELERAVALAVLDGTLTSDPLVPDSAPSPAATAEIQPDAHSQVEFAAPPQPYREPPPLGRSDESELAAAVRSVFLARSGAARAVFFCTPPGDPMSDTAWQAAELLASASGKRIAFVDDAATREVFVRPSSSLVTRIGWYPRGVQRNGKSTESRGSFSDLLSRFDFVIVNATAPTADDLVPLAREVNGVVVLIDVSRTPRAAAETLVTTLRNGGAHMLGVILTGGRGSRSTYPTQVNLRG
jgi:hypothetical protein